MLGRLFSRAQAPSQIPSAPPKLAPPPAAAPAAIEHEEEATERHTHFPTFAEVPKFVSVMAAPLVRLSAAEKETLVVIEQVGRVVLMLMADDGAAPESVVESVRGSLLSNRYAVNIGTAPRSVIASIYSGWQQADLTRGTSVNKYMQSFHEWITYAVENRATDIHLERRGSTGFVRMRIDGEVEPLRNENKGVYPGDYIERCMSTLYNNEQQRKSGSGSMFEPDKNLYCMVPYSEIAGHTLKLRYQSVTGNEGPKCVLRLLHVDEDAPTLTFEQLGYAPSHIDLWQQGMNTPSGAILIAGVTGSGKSTTQKSFLELNPSAPYMGIYTIEDPVEYPIKYAHQIPIQRDISDPVGSARKYGEAVSTLMRADPDAGMLGEIRDGPSATAMQQLTETGHMGLGTVHAHLLSGIVPRLSNREIGMSRDVITGPNMLTLAVYQALVPKLCPQCALSTEPSSATCAS